MTVFDDFVLHPVALTWHNWTIFYWYFPNYTAKQWNSERKKKEIINQKNVDVANVIFFQLHQSNLHNFLCLLFHSINGIQLTDRIIFIASFNHELSLCRWEDAHSFASVSIPHPKNGASVGARGRVTFIQALVHQRQLWETMWRLSFRRDYCQYHNNYAQKHTERFAASTPSMGRAPSVRATLATRTHRHSPS